LLLAVALLLLGCITPPPEPTPTPTAAPTATASPSPTPTATPTPEQTPTPQLGPSPYAHSYALIASGYSGTSRHAGWFRGSTLGMYSLLTQEYNFTPGDIYYLHEYTNYSEVDYEANIGNFYGVMREIANRSTEDDLVLIYLVGHGNEGGGVGGYTLTDSDISGPQFASLLSGVKARRIIIIMTPCNSGAFISSVSGAGRIIVTSTEPPESNSAGFAEYMIDGLKANATVASAFQRSTDSVFNWYRNNGMQQIREHPLLDDNGDGVGHRAPLPDEGDGYLAANTTLRVG